MTAENLALKRLSEYISIKTVHPEPDYETAVAFLCDYAKEIGIRAQVIRLPGSNKPVVIMSFISSSPKTKHSLLLNSHMDVVPVTGQNWSSDPFKLELSSDGKMIGRGTQDMKSVGIQHIEAIRRIKDSGTELYCDVHLSFVPDEEIGGIDGMSVLVHIIDRFLR